MFSSQSNMGNVLVYTMFHTNESYPHYAEQPLVGAATFSSPIGLSLELPVDKVLVIVKNIAVLIDHHSSCIGETDKSL